MDIKTIKSQFPIFSKKINNKPLVYLDSSNSAQKPISVLNSLDYFYRNEFSNVGRSIHSLLLVHQICSNPVGGKAGYTHVHTFEYWSDHCASLARSK